MSYTLPLLPYSSSALEPSIDSRTMEVHHDKHHATYVTNLNNALKDYPELAAKPVDELIADLTLVPEVIRTAVRNNGGGHSNHSFYWVLMTPGGSKAPVGKLNEELLKTFGSFEEFKLKFEAAGLARFGSGWVWLVLDKDNTLKIVATSNADLPLVHDQKALLTCDIWEHAYYLDYQNRRKDYVTVFLDHLVNWDFANQNLS
jgi:Fe-Mn family superoxide dismutase